MKIILKLFFTNVLTAAGAAFGSWMMRKFLNENEKYHKRKQIKRYKFKAVKLKKKLTGKLGS